MPEKLNTIEDQLADLEFGPPNYDYDGLFLPSSLVVDALFASHEDICDLASEELRDHTKKMREYDIVVFESAAHTPDTEKTLNKIAKGDYRQRERMLAHAQMPNTPFANWITATTKAIYNIKRPVWVIDPPRNHSSLKAAERARAALDLPSNLTFIEALDRVKTSQKAYAEAILERENYMLREFVESVNNLGSANPRVQQKLEDESGVNIYLWAFGTNHAGVHQGIQQVVDASGGEPRGQVEFFKADERHPSFHMSSIGRYTRGLEVDDSLSAKDLVLRWLMAKEPHQSNEPYTEYEARLSSQIQDLSIEELSSMYTELTKHN